MAETEKSCYEEIAEETKAAVLQYAREEWPVIKTSVGCLKCRPAAPPVKWAWLKYCMLPPYARMCYAHVCQPYLYYA